MPAVTTPVEPLEILECPVCGATELRNFQWCAGSRKGEEHQPAATVSVPVFLGNTVRPLYEAAAFGPDLHGDDPPPYLVAAVEAFPAPKEWER
jgi:hypothetical protein